MVALRVFVEPVADKNIWTIPTGALHPLAVLVVAGVGLLVTSMRRKLFLLAGFVAGLLPAILSDSSSISTHRMMMAFAFVPLAAGAAIAVLPRRALRAASAAILLVVASLASVPLYFSVRYWTADARDMFDAERTAVVEHLPDPLPGRIVFGDMGDYARMIPLSPATEELTVANWWPPVAATYVFGPRAGLMAPLYHQAFPGRVQQFGQAFYVTVDESARHGGLGPHGWQLTVICGGVIAHSAVVPAVFTIAIPPSHPACRTGSESVHVWVGQWEGPTTQMRLDYSGTAVVTLDGQTALAQTGIEQRIPFTIPHGAEVRIVIDSAPTGPYAVLLELLPGGMRLPSPEYVLPYAADACNGGELPATEPQTTAHLTDALGN